MKKLLKSGQRLLHIPVCLLFLLLAGCESADDVQPNALSADRLEEAKQSKTSLHYGPVTEIGDGTARVWVQRVQGKPVAIGIDMSAELMDAIDELGMFDIALKMPGQAHATGIKTITLGWNPMGHPPFPIYASPHFDFHFYLQTMGQIMQIEAGVDEGAYALQDKGVLPPTYSFGPVPEAAPHMGVHWVDMSSEEWEGFPDVVPGRFTKTFIYGSHLDKVTFLEPMITLEYLMSLAPGASVTSPIASLLIHEDPGYYPGQYTISHNLDGSYTIALIDLEWHNRNR